MLTLEDLGVLRDVRREGAEVVVTITPTYSGCPAMATMRDDLVHELVDAGYAARVEVVAEPGLVERLDHRAGPRRAARARPLGARSGAEPRRPDPAHPDPDRPRRCAARSAARPGPT